MHRIGYLRTTSEIDLTKVREFFRTTNNFFAILDMNKLVSEVQVRAAIDRLSRHLNGRIRDQGTVLMLLLSGQSQISKAVEAVGVGRETRKLLVIYETEKDLTEFLGLIGNTLEITDEKLPYDVPEMDREVFGKMSQAEIELW